MDIRRFPQLGAACALLLLALTATGVDAESPPCRVQDCPLYRVIRFYEELGCERSDDTYECCPSRFNCSKVMSLDKKKCHFKGKAYEPGEQITEDIITSICTPACTCIANAEGSGEAAFSCAHVDCPEHLVSEQLDDNCFRQYSLDSCCATGVECLNATENATENATVNATVNATENATEGRNDLLECSYNGRKFWEGQYIEVPESECLACVCEEGFDGTLDGPWCRKYSCEYTLTRKLSDITKCAPIFWKTRKCCPFSWHCPSRYDKVIGRSEPPPENDDQCIYGPHRLNIGEELRTARVPCIKCRCDIPPLVTCAQFDESECESLDEKDQF